ncbi:MAG: tryptophan transporter [Bacillota bacterium]|nr:tryptophan transporter [Bacillota bacterium]
MNTRKLTLSAILMAIGVILHYIVPGIGDGMKPDAFLSMMFIAILICDDYKSTLAIGFTAGILTALTTTFPGGQIPNIIDKLITCQIVFAIATITKKLYQQVRIFIISIIGTLVSGTVFLLSAQLIVGLPKGLPFSFFFETVVLPTVVLNTVLVVLVYNIVNTSLKRTSLKFN